MIPSFPLRRTIGKFGSAFSRKATSKDGNCERFPQVGRDGCNFRFGKKNCRAYFTQLLPDGAPPPLTLSPRWPGTIFVRFSERNRSTIETIIQPVEEDGLLGAVDLGGKLDRIRCTRGLMECVIGAGNRSPAVRTRTHVSMSESCLASMQEGDFGFSNEPKIPLRLRNWNWNWSISRGKETED